MQAVTTATVPNLLPVEAAPGPLPRPPGQPPAEPIVIRTPPRRRGDLEIDVPHGEDEERGGEIRRPPDWVPDLPVPPPPEERAERPWRRADGPQWPTATFPRQS
jgi:hypothetical protein